MTAVQLSLLITQHRRSEVHLRNVLSPSWQKWVDQRLAWNYNSWFLVFQSRHRFRHSLPHFTYRRWIRMLTTCRLLAPFELPAPLSRGSKTWRLKVGNEAHTSIWKPRLIDNRSARVIAAQKVTVFNIRLTKSLLDSPSWCVIQNDHSGSSVFGWENEFWNWRN